MSILAVFENFEIRFVEHPEEKYGFGIVADDLATILDHSNSRSMSDSVNSDWKGVSNVYTLGGTQSMTVIWEPGIYQMLAVSRKPKAKIFQKWLFEEVLPSIRKTGKYSIDKTPIAERQLPPIRDAIDYANAAIAVQGLKDGILKQLISDLLVDELSLDQNLKYLPVTEKPKQYTIAKVRAKSLGYTETQIGSGTSLGRFVKSQIEPAFQEQIGRFPVYHYEINSALDTAIHTFFK